MINLLLKILRKIKAKLFYKDIELQKCNKKSIWDDSAEQYLRGGYQVYWEKVPKISHYQFESVSNNPNVDIFSFAVDFIKEKYNGRKVDGCFLGCDELSRPEIKFSKANIINEITVYDIAKGLLQKQQKLAEDENINNIKYTYADLNNIKLKENHFDFIFGWGTIHHIEKLEHIFNQIQKSLKPSGNLMLREYCGPNYIQLTDNQLNLANALLDILPKEFKKTPDGNIKLYETRVDKNALKQIDPTESIRSQDILKILNQYFEIHKLCKTGGTILHPLLNQIAFNFVNNERGEEIVQALIDIEKILINSDLIPSDYVFIIAKPNKGN